MLFDQNQSTLTIGKARFKKPLPSQIFNNSQLPTSSTVNLSILYTDKWFLTFSAFKDGKWPIIFPHIQSLSCQLLYITSSNYPLILHSITLPHYTNLRHLVLNSNRINNIEALSFLQAHNLQQLSLECNLITQMKVFNKLNCGKLVVVVVGFNWFARFDQHRLRVKRDNAEDRVPTFGQNAPFQDTCLLAKFQINRIKDVDCSFPVSLDKILQQKAGKAIRQKFIGPIGV